MPKNDRPVLTGALVIGVLLLVAGLVAACGGQPAPAPTAPVAQAPTQASAPTHPPPTQAPPTNTAVPPTPTVVPATATTAPTVAPTTAPTTAPTAAPVAADANNCVKCHTSQETLQKLAKAEEPTEKLSEGEG